MLKYMHVIGVGNIAIIIGFDCIEIRQMYRICFASGHSSILTNKTYPSSFQKSQAVPSKGVCRQFEIDSNEHGEFDVANELWALMEGKQPALAC